MSVNLRYYDSTFNIFFWAVRGIYFLAHGAIEDRPRLVRFPADRPPDAAMALRDHALPVNEELLWRKKRAGPT